MKLSLLQFLKKLSVNFHSIIQNRDRKIILSPIGPTQPLPPPPRAYVPQNMYLDNWPDVDQTKLEPGCQALCGTLILQTLSLFICFFGEMISPGIKTELLMKIVGVMEDFTDFNILSMHKSSFHPLKLFLLIFNMLYFYVNLLSLFSSIYLLPGPVT